MSSRLRGSLIPMGRIVMPVSVSLDGFHQGPDADLGWHLVDEELHEHFNTELARMSAFLDGRVSYELMAGYWPTADQDPTSSPAEVAFAKIWRDMPKVVYSRTLTEAGWNSTIVREVVPEEVRAMADAAPGDLALGGARLAAEFRRHGLVDEYRLYVVPVVLGAGTPLFDPAEGPIRLALAGTRTFGNGVVLLRYHPV
jgi:dihydrofolate reductase